MYPEYRLSAEERSRVPADMPRRAHRTRPRRQAPAGRSAARSSSKAPSRPTAPASRSNSSSAASTTPTRPAIPARDRRRCSSTSSTCTKRRASASASAPSTSRSTDPNQAPAVARPIDATVREQRRANQDRNRSAVHRQLLRAGRQPRAPAQHDWHRRRVHDPARHRQHDEHGRPRTPQGDRRAEDARLPERARHDAGPRRSRWSSACSAAGSACCWRPLIGMMPAMPFIGVLVSGFPNCRHDLVGRRSRLGFARVAGPRRRAGRRRSAPTARGSPTC